MAWLRVPWQFYGVVCGVRQSGGYHGALTASSVRYGGVVISMALYIFVLIMAKS